MSDRAALLSAISAQPEEDTPRLVYADWLDEHGGTAGAKRAAYIRGEVARYHLERADTAASAASDFVSGDDRVNWSAVDADLGARAAAEKAAHKRRVRLTAKGEGAPTIKGVRFLGPERGFFSCAWVENPAAFLRHADAIFRAAPIIELVFQGLNAEQAADLVRAGHLAKVRELELRGPVDPGAVRVLGASRDAAGVRSLEMPLRANGAAVAAALTASRNWTGVERLHATGYRSDPDATSADPITELLAARPFPNLRELRMWAAMVNDDGARAIARTLPELRFADLAINDITGAGAEALAASKSLRHLRYLELSTCDIDSGPAGSSLIGTANLPSLTVLKLDGNGFRLDSKVLSKGRRAPTLRALALNGGFTPAALEGLVRSPAVRGLWRLDLSATSTGNEHVERFVRHAAFERLTALDLCHNDLTARGAKALAGWPGASGLQWLDLGANSLGETGARALAASPHLAGLRWVRFTGRGTATVRGRFKKAFQE